MLRTSRSPGVPRRMSSRRRAPLRPEQLIVIGDYHRARQGFPSDVELARAMGVHRSRVAAWKTGALPDPANARLLAEIAFVVQDLRRYLHPDVVHDWLDAPKIEAQGRTPLELLRQGEFYEVLMIANATEYGTYI